MMYISGKDYDSTKLIKQGKKVLDPSFDAFAQWVFEEFGVKPINIIYDNIDPHNIPRLNLVFERQGEAQIFHNKEDAGYQEIKRKAVMEKFKELHAAVSSSNIWILFQEFEPAAKSECNENIPALVIEDFKSKFSSDLLSEVSRFGAYTTFFFYTAKQLKDSKLSGLQLEIKKAYLDLLKAFDEFGYFTLENMLVVFDSQESPGQ